MTQENHMIDNVSKKILEDAYLEKDKIISDAHEKEDEILKTAENKRKNIINNAKAEAEIVYKKVKDLEISNAKMKLHQESLLSKIKLIDEIAEKALGKLKSQDSGLYLNFIKNSIRNLKVSEADYQIGNKEKLITIETLKSISDDVLLNPSAKPTDFENGIKIIDGKKQYIISAETALKEKIEDIRMELSEFLFEKE